MNAETPTSVETVPSSVDVVVVGAGIAGLYALHKFRSQGLTVQVFEAADGVGGVWYWNRYPGARCDVESVDYSYSFDEALQQEWNWSEKYATQPEILAYLNHVADRFDLRRDIEFGARVTDAVLDESSLRWEVRTDTGTVVSARFLVLAVGPLSNANTPDIEGLGTFAGPVLHTSQWPHDGVDFTGQRVGVIGTGSSGIQAIPCIAEQAESLHVFQRTPNYSVPAGNVPLDEETRRAQKANYAERRRLSMASGGGSPHQPHPKSALEVSEQERREAYQKRWELGGVLFSKTFPDQMVTLEANDTARLFWEEKVRAVIDDPEVAELLIPKDHPIGTKRICTDTNYYQTYNRDNVELVNLRATPIDRIDAGGVHTTTAYYPLDALVLATGFDAMTGSVAKLDIVGRDGRTLNEAWREGPKTYLGLGVTGFPNLFNLTGPGSPSVLANMVLHSELHVDWVAGAIDYLDRNGAAALEARPEAVEAWVAECAERASRTLMPTANSWYLGANVPGKPRVFMPFVGGFGVYGEIIAEVAAAEYKGFDVIAG
ncbi:NAD(P)/FAD-dependent oxidoreductase [Nocardia cyriacigeorgica]|uniref:flavin-containing monooxygenase n=1 Tax=Nocardia cyriacigeorgica TaxID=135487 RepID=UPI0018942C06|nr:NAD(P)/FAD-dependent oxidoreductase [Nocardia cyriacigeorgica]MBF6089943.1 NAD(P)/FAD-dependent oxidoreductase [Nocardia cyriacigeorgica]MBF6100369.1 NAD(P)/FAD-dependent oxidoreductase [Nocardia cyriacigeorgica]MBF6326042.1 NAD(P)/FAD-dependent oxidoreductase [Nocardia cyriacigeorgica]MBF6399599.1 NAD(P)/FAD-dependent oxidoreductase [Nocardia cyriacigeorgica]MBF6405229.1 NAD(P)/FAD-dependent oxidoreductase [Nocardia cyriacigeorgica]